MTICSKIFLGGMAPLPPPSLRLWALYIDWNKLNFRLAVPQPEQNSTPLHCETRQGNIWKFSHVQRANRLVNKFQLPWWTSSKVWLQKKGWRVEILGTDAGFALRQWFSSWSRDPGGSWTIFGGAANRYFMYTAILNLLYSSFRWESLGYSGLL